jgi:hypothetical protein
LKYALDEVGAIPPASNHIPPDIKCVTLKQWRTYFYQRSSLAGEPDKPDSRLKGFQSRFGISGRRRQRETRRILGDLRLVGVTGQTGHFAFCPFCPGDTPKPDGQDTPL